MSNQTLELMGNLGGPSPEGLPVAASLGVEYRHLAPQQPYRRFGHLARNVGGAALLCAAALFAAYNAPETSTAINPAPAVELSFPEDIPVWSHRAESAGGSDPVEVQPGDPRTALCQDPGQLEGSTSRLDAARRCADISIGTVGLSIYDDTKRPLGGIITRVKSLDRKYSQGERTLQVRTKRVASSMSYYFSLRSESQGFNDGGDCIVMGVDPPAASIMQEFGKDQGRLVSVFTDRISCDAEGNTRVSGGIANGRGGNDVYDVGEQSISDRSLADVEMHELGHSFGFGHVGTYLLKKLEARSAEKRTIPKRFFVGNRFNLSNYLSKSTSKVYDPSCDYVMGLTCDAGNPEIPPAQRVVTQSWWKKMLGIPIKQKINQLDSGSFTLATNKGSTDVGIVNLAEAIEIPPAVDEISAPDLRFAGKLIFDVVTIKGKKTALRMYLGTKGQNNFYSLGNLDLASMGGTAVVELPGSQTITIEELAGKNATFTVTRPDPQLPVMK